MKLSVTTDLQGALNKLNAAGGSGVRFVREQIQIASRTLVSSSGKVPGLLQVTPPFHDGIKGNQARMAGEKAISDDIKAVYAKVGDLYPIFKAYGTKLEANEYWYMVRHHPEKLPQWLSRNGPSQVQAMKHGWDGGREHEVRRVKGSVKGRWPSVVVLPGQEAELRAYIKTVQKKVGLLASCVPAAYNGRFGHLRGVPGWVKRHRGRWASFHAKEISGGFRVRIVLASPYALKDMQRRFDEVLDYRYRALARSLPFALRAEMKKLGR